MCTTMIITKGATANGAMVVTHSDDDELSDQRVIHVPAADHGANDQRDILAESYNYPRLVSASRGPYYDTPGWDKTDPIGQIPQASHTYSYYDANYGIINEHGLMMGECTNSARYEPKFVSQKQSDEDPKKHIRLMYSSELSRIALERCRSARDAVQLMGDLIDEYGYYSEGETLLVADQNEGWVFEMCALPDEDRHSAWIAQRVPDGEVFVAANMFRIRDIVGGDDQMFSDHLKDDLESVGYWNKHKDPVCDWMHAISPGEYNHPYYSLRRVWRVFDRVNPDLGLSPWVGDTYTRQYPFSVRPNRLLQRSEIFDLYRDHYEGTEFDLTRGIAAGPYGDPHRFVGPYDGNQNNADGGIMGKPGAWERAISVFYQGYTYVLESTDETDVAGGLMWFAPDVSYTSVFTPFWAAACHLPESFQIGNPRKYDPGAAWWVFDFVGNWARLNWQQMITADIRPLQQKLEADSFDMVADVLAEVSGGAGAVSLARENADANARRILEEWSDLGHTLIAKYSDGYINHSWHDRSDAVAIGYPSHWLSETDYPNGPTSYAMPVRKSRGQM